MCDGFAQTVERGRESTVRFASHRNERLRLALALGRAAEGGWRVSGHARFPRRRLHSKRLGFTWPAAPAAMATFVAAFTAALQRHGAQAAVCDDRVVAAFLMKYAEQPRTLENI